MKKLALVAMFVLLAYFVTHCGRDTEKTVVVNPLSFSGEYTVLIMKDGPLKCPMAGELIKEARLEYVESDPSRLRGTELTCVKVSCDGK